MKTFASGGDALGDLHHLLFPDREPPAGLRGRKLHAQPGQHLLGFLLHAAAVEQAHAARLAPEKQILRHAQVGQHRELLEHRGDAGRARGRGPGEGHGSARRPAPGRGPARCTPARIFIKVDLPAPFSPVIAWTEPALPRKLTSASAAVDPKDLETPSTDTSTRPTSDRSARSAGVRHELAHRRPLSDGTSL